MRLDKALGHQEIRFVSDAVEQQAVAGSHRAQIHKAVVVVRVMDDDALMGDDVLAVAIQKLLLRRGAVAACGHKDGNVGFRISGADFPQNDGHQQAAGDRARMIAGYDDDFLLAANALAQRQTAVRMRNGVFDQLGLRFFGGVCGDAAVHHGFEVFFRHVQRERAFAVREGNGCIHGIVPFLRSGYLRNDVETER